MCNNTEFGVLKNTDLVPLQEKDVLQLPLGKLLFLLNMSFFQFPNSRLPRAKKLKQRFNTHKFGSSTSTEKKMTMILVLNALYRKNRLKMEKS
jgi:hypothetical protein